MSQFIVGEVSKNLDCAVEATRPLVCQLFEAMIAHNLECGYRLYSFNLHRLMTSPTSINETIIAVFERAEEPDNANE